MFKFFDSGTYPIGIDVGAENVRLLQFRKGAAEGGAQGLALQAACKVDLPSLKVPEKERFATAMRQALDAQNFAGKRVVISLPISAVQAKSVRLPQMPDSDLTQALQWEAKDRFGFDVGDSAGQLVWFRAGEVRRGTEVKDELLLFAVNGETVNSYIAELTSLGLQIAAIDLAPTAAYRGAKRAAPATLNLSSGTSALLDLGHNGSQFQIARGGELVFFKHIDIGGRAVNEAIAAKLGISVEEALAMRARLGGGGGGGESAGADEETAPLNQALRDAMRTPLEELSRELDMCMRYYVVTFRGARPETIGVTGRQAACAEVREILAAALGLQMEEAQSLRGVQNLGDAARPDRSGEWAVAAGLSLYPVNAGGGMEAAA